MRCALDGGRPLEDILRQQRPPLHFKRKASIEQHCRTWSVGELNAAVASINAAAKAARLASGIEATLAAKLLIDLAAIGERQDMGKHRAGEARP